ncbi:MAG TPA: 23S rRNA (adenine(2503)-C(2))-methyltransferase RlmN [Bacteroidia bacterium]|nr:23S rRNA (adenine(2503)-C(2))-methyltransferase RlmN [Bacteroidia bacterium]
MNKPDIRHFNFEQLQNWVKENNLPSYRAQQIYDWLWLKNVSSFDEMSDIPKSLRQKLSEHFEIKQIQTQTIQISKDKTIKCAIKLFDGNVVESVLIPTSTRVTACVSSQVGCSLDCKFCATAQLKRKRNLDYQEIYQQVYFIKELAKDKYNLPLTNIVYMGMGEPLLNYSNVMKSIEMITSPKGLGMSPQRITVSTSGIAKMIVKMADEKVKFNLALSLHSAIEEKRRQIMSISESNTLEMLANALNYFYEKTGTRPTLEYVMLYEFNDSIKDAESLANFCRKVKSKVNLIEYNPVENSPFKRTTKERLENFVKYLEKKKIIVTVRRSRGIDIDAACGQLVNKNVLMKEN